MRAAAKVIQGRKVAPSVHAMVVPGSGLVKHQAEEEGLRQAVHRGGFEWREPATRCLGMNPDQLAPASAAPARRTATSRVSQGRAAAPTSCPPRWPPPPRSPAASRTCASCVGAALDVRSDPRRPVPPTSACARELVNLGGDQPSADLKGFAGGKRQDVVDRRRQAASATPGGRPTPKGLPMPAEHPRRAPPLPIPAAIRQPPRRKPSVSASPTAWHRRSR